MRKQAILELLETMPEDIDKEELYYRLYVLQKIEEGQAAIAAGDVISDEDLDKEMEHWRD
jgi:hypothetical protein